MTFIIEYIYAPVDAKRMPELREPPVADAKDKDEAMDIAMETGDIVLAAYLEQRGLTPDARYESIDFRINPQPLWTKQRGEVANVLQGLLLLQDVPETIPVPAPGMVDEAGFTDDSDLFGSSNTERGDLLVLGEGSTLDEGL